MPRNKLPQIKKDDPFVDLYSARLLLRTIVWATTEIIELVRVDMANRYDLKYRRRFIKRPSIYDIDGLKDRTEREGMHILLLKPEDERVINSREPYLDDYPTAMSPYALYQMTAKSINSVQNDIREIAPDWAIDHEHSIFYSTQLKKMPIDGNFHDILDEVLIITPEGLSIWIAALIHIVHGANNYVSKILKDILTACTMLDVPTFTKDAKLVINKETILPSESKLTQQEFNGLSSRLDYYLLQLKTISVIYDTELAATNIQMVYKEIESPKVTTKKRYAVTVKQVATDTGLSQRTIEKWESGEIKKPDGYPGRINRAHYLMWLAGYNLDKGLKEEARNKDRAIADSFILERYRKPTGKRHKRGKSSMDDEMYMED